MRIVIVGGLDRNVPLLERLSKRAGHRLEAHDGHLDGRAAVEALRARIERADVVVVPLDINSHGAVQLAQRLGREAARPVVVLRTSGVARYKALLEELAVGHVPLAA